VENAVDILAELQLKQEQSIGNYNRVFRSCFIECLEVVI